MCVNQLNQLAEFAIALNAHAPLKRQNDGSLTLFVCVDEIPNDYGEDVTSWNHVITVNENSEKFEIRFSKNLSTRQLTLEEAKEIIGKWISNPLDKMCDGYKHT